MDGGTELGCDPKVSKKPSASSIKVYVKSLWENTFRDNTFWDGTFGDNTFGDNTLWDNTFGDNTLWHDALWDDNAQGQTYVFLGFLMGSLMGLLKFVETCVSYGFVWVC